MLCVSSIAHAQQAPAEPVVPTPDAITSLADRANSVNAAVGALEAKLPALTASLSEAETTVTRIGGAITDEQRRASELLSNAKYQALSAYIRGDSSNQPYAMALAMQHSSNDAAWSLGLIQVSNRRTVDMVRAARSRGSQASRELTDALSQRERARDAIARLSVDIHNSKITSKVVAEQLTQTIVALAPGTIDGMTTVAYDAYRRAAVAVGAERASCGLRWELLAAIGRTESGHGMGRLDSSGTTSPPILGPSIGGDTDRGEIDTDPNQDHAVGPMQFIPSTWRSYGADGNGDGKVDINNIYDESLAAGRYLCVAAGALTLTTKEGVTKAILAYNPNQEYLRTVGGRFESLAQDVAAGWFSSAVLPTAPAAALGSAAGGTKPVDPQTAPTPNTQARTLVLFGPAAPAVPAIAGDPAPAVCESPTVRLASRVGMYRCVMGTQVLDPCVPAPYDLTLLACVADPEQPVQLIKVGAPMPTTTMQPAPPYFSLQLFGGDRCLPIAPANAPPPVITPTTTTSTTSTTVVASTIAVTPDATTVPASSSTVVATTTTSPVAPTTTTTTTTGSTSTSGSSTTTALAGSSSTSAPRRAKARKTAAADPPAMYKCASGAEIVGQPAVTAGVWFAVIRQPGIAQRQAPVSIAWQ